MDDTELLAGIRTVAARHLGYRGEITPETRIVEAMRLDSVRLLTLVVELENHFQVNLEEGDEAGIQTVGDLMRVLKRRLERR